MDLEFSEGSLEQLAGAPCPAPSVVLLAIAGEFGPVDAGDIFERLDDAARLLFGLNDHPAAVHAQRLAEVMASELGFNSATGWSPSTLLVDRVVQRRSGHPVVLAALAVELCWRAGTPAAVYSSTDRWFIGLGQRERLVLLDGELGASGGAPPTRVRRHCAHEIGFCVLTGLVAAFLAEQRLSEARRACRLRLHLPMSDGLLETVRNELRTLPQD